MSQKSTEELTKSVNTFTKCYRNDYVHKVVCKVAESHKSFDFKGHGINYLCVPTPKRMTGKRIRLRLYLNM